MTLLTNKLELIVRNKIFNSSYWKEQCFGLNSESLIDKALALKYIGGINSSSGQPCEFVCLVMKLLQLNPKREIIEQYLSDPELKYLRALALFFVRLTFPPPQIYAVLEQFYSDHHKLRVLTHEGKFDLLYMDEFVDMLLTDEIVLNLNLGKLVRREILEEKNELRKYVSVLEEEIRGVERRLREESGEEVCGGSEESSLLNKKRKGSEGRKGGEISDAEEEGGNDEGEEYWMQMRVKLGIK